MSGEPTARVIRNVSAPVLILHGGSDVLAPVSYAQAVYDDIGYPDKTLLVYPPGTPGCAHCQLDALGVAQRHICDWLDDKLRA